MLVKVLIQFGADINAVNIDNRNVIYLCRKWK